MPTTRRSARRRRKTGDIEFARRNHDLAFGAVDLITIDINAGKGVVGPQAVDLLKLRLQRPPIPDARILQCRAIRSEVGGRERLARHREFALFDPRSGKIISGSCASNAPDEKGQLQGDLVWADIERFDPGGYRKGAEEKRRQHPEWCEPVRSMEQ